MDDTLTHEIADLERRGAILDNAELLKLWKAITKGGLHTSDDLEFFWKELLSLKEELDKLHTIREKVYHDDCLWRLYIITVLWC